MKFTFYVYNFSSSFTSFLLGDVTMTHMKISLRTQLQKTDLSEYGKEIGMMSDYAFGVHFLLDKVTFILTSTGDYLTKQQSDRFITTRLRDSPGQGDIVYLQWIQGGESESARVKTCLEEGLDAYRNTNILKNRVNFKGFFKWDF